VSEFRRVAANAGWNLLGNLLPLGAAIVAVPYLIGQMGTDRFGLLSLTWVLIGYFSLFDFGLGRALTKLIAERQVGSRNEELSSLCSSAIALVAVLGLVGMLVVAALIPFAGRWVDKLGDTALQQEANLTLVWVAAGVPLAVVTAAMRGILEGYQRFKLLNAIRIPAGIALFAAPCATAWFSPRLDLAVGAVVVTRLLILLAHVAPCQRLVPLRVSQVKRLWAVPLLSFGGWLTVSNFIGPLIVYMDRFIIGAVLSASTVAYYTAPFEVVSRLLLFPAALTAALFPALTHAHGTEFLGARSLRRQAQLLTLAIMLPLALFGAVFAHQGLSMWLGDEFAVQSSRAMQLLMPGFVFNAMALIPFTTLHSLGRTRQTALLHLAELLPFVGLLFFMVRHWGLEGAALAWTLRAIVDWAAMTYLLAVYEP
jgi:O-antigen/teichoic acid export membrane protein